MRLFLLISALAFLAGCPGGTSTAVPKTCKSAGAKCQLAPGKLGVCTFSNGSLRCMSQH